MKRFIVSILTLALIAGAGSANAQKREDLEKYRRSSLVMMLMEDPAMNPEIADYVRKAYEEAKAPKKFNDHNIDGHRIFIPVTNISEADYAAYDAVNPPKKEKVGAMLGKGLLSLATQYVSDGQNDGAAYLEEQKKLRRDLGTMAYKYLLEQDIAHKAMDKWFNNPNAEAVTAEGLDLSVIMNRAYEDANKLDKQSIAQSSDILGDLMDKHGYELIGNTFVTVSNYRYMTAEEYAAEMEKLMNAMSGGMAGNLMSSATSLGSSFSSKDAYVVAVKTYLFQLVWNDDVRTAIESNHTNYQGYMDSKFSLKFVGYETAHSSCGTKKDRSQEDIVKIATMRAFDKVIAKLEKKYEVFRTKTPLLTVGDGEFTMGIGTMESVEEKDRYEVLEQTQDPKTGRTVYVRKGILTVAPDGVWDNAEFDDNGDMNANYNADGATRLTGKAKNLYPGMLLRYTSDKK